MVADATCSGANATACLACSHHAAGAGCVVAPRTDCRRPTRAQRALLDVANRPNDERDAFVFSWSKGAATAAGDFGSPLGAHDVDVCLYDATNHVLFTATAPAGRDVRGEAVLEVGREGLPLPRQGGDAGRAHARRPRAGAARKASVLVEGHGAPLELAALAGMPPLTAEVDTGGACFAGTFDTPRPNTATRVKAKGT